MVFGEALKLKDYLLNGGFVFLHLGCLLVIWTGVSPIAVAVCIALYALRMFFITAFYHRYFAHRSYKTSRAFQFMMAVAGATCFQNGPLWWAAHHRHHHRYSDTEHDVHSPIVKSFWWAHAGWILSKKFNSFDPESVKDLHKYPEMRWIQTYNILPGVAMGILVFTLGEALAIWAPGLGTNGLQMLAWGFFVSTTILYHATFTINSLAHKIGRRRFKTDDHSRNSLILALITFGEGWHNNHHRYHASERQGFYWWEIDLSHYGLVLLSKLGLVWDLKAPPQRVFDEAEKGGEVGSFAFRRRNRKLDGADEHASRPVAPAARAVNGNGSGTGNNAATGNGSGIGSSTATGSATGFGSDNGTESGTGKGNGAEKVAANGGGNGKASNGAPAAALRESEVEETAR